MATRSSTAAVESVSALFQGGPARTCPFTPANFDDRPHTHATPPPPAPIESSFQLLAYQAARRPDADCIGWRPLLPPGYVAPPPGELDAENPRPFLWWSYATVLELSIKFGKGLIHRFGLQKGDKIGVYARNCPWWGITSLACASQGLVVVPIYDTLGPNIVEYVCNHAEVKVVVVSAEQSDKKPDNSDKLADALTKCSTVTGVVVIELNGSIDASDVTKDKVSSAYTNVTSAPSQVAVVPAADLIAVGGDGNISDAAPSAWDDLCVIMYTSGTTGDPKGVMLKNSCIMASVSSAYTYFEHYGQTFDYKDSILSYLPLSHIFEQQVEALFFGCGGRIGYFSGDVKLLLDDLNALKPTVFAGVPRVFARFQERISQNVESASVIQRTLFNWAYERQLRAEQHPVGPEKVARSGIWDALVFKKVRGKILPNCRMAITGSAPMSAQTNDYLKVCLNCPVAQGYGLTETVGGMNCSPPGSSVSGTCGGPLPGVYVKLVDVPDMEYLSSDKPNPRGEVCVKGSIVTSGYYKNPIATAESFDADGYFHTGDIGQWLEDGSLQIIDRKKNLFKLAQGEYVSPENLEQEYNKCKLVGQIFVYGNSLESTLLAVVVPDIPASKTWAAANAKGLTDVAAIGSLPAFKKELLAQLDEMREISKFKRYEEIKDVIIETGDLNDMGQGFHVGNDLMTPSFKLKRPQLNKKYKVALEALYEASKKSSMK